MAVGELVVKLGLDAAEYTQGLTKAELQARRFGEVIGEGIRTAAIGAAAGLAALAASSGAALAGFNKLLDSAAKFQDLAEETGNSATAIAGYAVAAATAGVSVESVAASMNKLTKNLVGVDDESKAAGAALAALGVNVADFKALDPAGQYQAVSTALAGFADGAGKTAVAMALFGKAGAEQLRVLKALEEQGGATNILTAEQIALADEYRDKQAKATATLELYASAMATQAIPALTVLTSTLTDVIKEMIATGGATSDLGANTGVQTFAENAVQYLGRVLDACQIVARGFDIVGTSIGVLAATAVQLASGNVGSAVQIQLDGAKDLYNKVANIGDNLVSDRIKKNLAAQKQAAADAAKFGFGNRPGVAKPQVNFTGAVKSGGKGKTDNSAAQEAKAQLASDLDAIKNAQEAITNSYANQEKILEALRSAGLKDETTYYQEKQRLVAQTATAQEDALQKQIARLQQEQLSGKDAIDNAKKIADAEAKLAKVREDSATQAQVLGIQQAAAYKQIEAAILSARQAAQDFFDTTNRGYARELAGIGKGTKSRTFDAGITQIEDKYRQQRQDLQNQRRQDELKGISYAPGTDAAKKFDGILADINSFQQKSIDSYKTYYDALNEAQSNWLNGATEALHNYSDEASNVAKHTEEVFTNAFKGLEDQFTNLLSGKKFDGKKLLEDLQGDLTRNFVKENITGPLAKLGGDLLGDGGLLSGIFGGKASKNDPLGGKGSSATNPLYVRSADGVANALGGGSSGGLLASLFGGGGKDELGDFLKSNNLVSGAGGGSSWLTSLFSLFGKAGGGSVDPGQLVRVNENGPELLDVNGKQFLLNGNRNARITPNERIGAGGGFQQSNTFVIHGRPDYDTQSQIANKVRRQTNTAAARFN